MSGRQFVISWFFVFGIQSLQDVTGAEFKLFMDFLRSFSIFGDGVPPERIQELIEIVEGQADLDAQFNVSKTIGIKGVHVI